MKRVLPAPLAPTIVSCLLLGNPGGVDDVLNGGRVSVFMVTILELTHQN